MAKWKIEKSTASVDFIYPWTTISPAGTHLSWSTFLKALSYIRSELFVQSVRKARLKRIESHD